MKQFLSRLLRRLFTPRYDLALANIAEGTHEGAITKLADAAITTRFLLVKFGTNVNHIAANDASDCPLGVCTDEPTADEAPVNVDLLGCGAWTRKVVASEAIDYNEDVYTAASGKVQDEPTAAGTYYHIGRAIQSASADGDVIEIVPTFPTAFVVP